MAEKFGCFRLSPTGYVAGCDVVSCPFSAVCKIGDECSLRVLQDSRVATLQMIEDFAEPAAITAATLNALQLMHANHPHTT